MITPTDALARLREGNRRFVENQTTGTALTHQARAALVAGQAPFAIVLGCSDSRVPAELVFDQGFGDLFVIRVAGNVVAPSQVGSVEFAAARFGTRLVVVMGHSQCGAVVATLEELEEGTANGSRNLRSITDRVRPSVEPLVRTAGTLDREVLLREAIRANVRASVEHLRHGSELLEGLIRNDGLVVVGAEVLAGNWSGGVLRRRALRFEVGAIPFDLQPVLEGELLILRPLQASDFDDLFAVAADPLIWEQHPAPDRYKEQQFRTFFRESLESTGALIAIDRRDGRIIGSSRFHGYDRERSEIEIGWTFLARSHWGGRYNGEMKRLMLLHAFRFVDRVVFLVGPQNLRSQRAVEKIGAVRAGSVSDAGGRASIVYEITGTAYGRQGFEK